MRDIKLEEPVTAPAFILSCERSGSTMLRYIVDTHSQACCPGELALGSLCNALRLTLTRTPRNADSRMVELQALAETREIVSGIMNAYARAKGKKLWCEKTPWNLQHLPTLAAVFPDAKYICLYRNCVDVVHSCLETSRHGFMPELARYVARMPGNLVAAMMESWSEKTAKLIDFEAQHPGKSFRVTYESMVTSPETTLPALFSFLGLSWEPELLQRAFHTHHDSGGGDPKVRFTDRIELDRINSGTGIPLRDVSDTHRKRANDLLIQLGYPQLGTDYPIAASSHSVKRAEAGNLTSRRIREIFELHVPERLKRNADVLRLKQASFKFVVTGDDCSSWLVVFREMKPSVLEGNGTADCTVTISDSVLLKITSGQLNPYSAYQEGLVRIDGDMRLVPKIASII